MSGGGGVDGQQHAEGDEEDEDDVEEEEEIKKMRNLIVSTNNQHRGNLKFRLGDKTVIEMRNGSLLREIILFDKKRTASLLGRYFFLNIVSR